MLKLPGVAETELSRYVLAPPDFKSLKGSLNFILENNHSYNKIVSIKEDTNSFGTINMGD